MEGPWSFGSGIGDLLIVVDFDGSKRLKDLEFLFTPVWVWVLDLPLGLMNANTGKEIGDKMGKTLVVDVDEDGSTVGSYLRIKVRLDIRKPLMRVIMVKGDQVEEGMWCSL
ncbi:hypothetical protein QOZ80_7BG0583860 [Eleusine coracana subsp. coracana]|nr:hypothetical protein QOZ80_7BG0583860 [Eleusine coracana subsp. coracana]